MTLREIRQACLVGVTENAPPGYVASTYSRMIKAELDRVARLAHIAPVSDDVSAVAGTATYTTATVTTGGFPVEAVWYEGNLLAKVSLAEYEQGGGDSTESGTPVYWYPTSTGFGVAPVPDSAGTLRYLIGVGSLDLTDDDDVCSLPDDLIQAVIQTVRAQRAAVLTPNKYGPQRQAADQFLVDVLDKYARLYGPNQVPPYGGSI